MLVRLFNNFHAPSSRAMTERTLASRPSRRTLPKNKSQEEKRREELSSLEANFRKTPETAISGLLSFVTQKIPDKPQKEALQLLLTHYEDHNQFLEAGNLMMTLGDPATAVNYFLRPPPNYTRAEEALFASFQKKRDRTVLIRDIELILSKLKDRPLAIQRIDLFSKEFPDRENPFSYYRLPKKRQLLEMFKLNTYLLTVDALKFLQAEFEALVFESRPKLELKKSSRGTYQIRATYEGRVHLKREDLSSVSFRLWLTPSRWVLIDSNFTTERHEMARKNKALTAKNATWKQDDLIQYLEDNYQNQFPDSILGVKPGSIPPLRSLSSLEK